MQIIITLNHIFKGEEGVPNKRECKNGLFWNQEKKSCDFPENVHCQIISKRGLIPPKPIEGERM